MRKVLGLLFFICFFGVLGSNLLPDTMKSLNPSQASTPIEKKKKVVYNETAVDFLPDDEVSKKWVDSIYNQMSLDEKIGQLFMVAAYSNKNEKHAQSIDSLIINQKIGGVIFFQGGPMRQAKLTNRFQSKAKIPLFVGIDAEWGLAMRLDSTFAFPWNMTLGAIRDEKLIEQVGVHMARHSKRMGIHFNFAPVVDVNTNPLNPIIGNRSFGESPENVADKAIALVKGIQSQGVFATAKHFPGHGDTDKDSHHTLPSINHSEERINEVELYPFKKLFREGVASVMVAHLNIPAFETREGYPSSISPAVVTELLQEKLKFKGLIFTDALNMKGASNFKNPGEIDLEAFLAGNDILLFPENVPVAVEKFKIAMDSAKLTEKRLEHSVKKILKYKYQAGLNKYQPIDVQNLHSDLNTSQDQALNHKLMENALTVLKNKNQILPIQNLEKQKIAYVKMGGDDGSHFLETLQNYADVTEVEDSTLVGLQEKLQAYTTVIVGYHKSNGSAWRKHDFTTQELTWLYEIARTNNVILSVFAKPYCMSAIQTFENIEGVIVSYQNSKVGQETTANLIFGSSSATGKLPVSINAEFPVGSGLKVESINRLGFDVPENVGMSSAILTNIDIIAQETMSKNIAPGMQILVARKGKVVYNKSFGFHTYDNVEPVRNSDLYDVASLTKILATLPMVVKEFDAHHINLNTKLSEMLSEFAKTDKKDITLKEMLTHNAGFVAWMPFYKSTLDSITKLPNPKIYSNTYSPDFPDQVAENLFIKKGYTEVILKQIAESKLGKKEYKYSDFSFILLKEFLERKTGQPLDKLIDEHFYQSMGMHRTTFNPLRKFDLSEIVPTEQDNYYRHQLIRGYVHDMAAAMQGGVAGQAGLFSNAVDVAKMMQLYLQKGEYAEKSYFSKKTFDKFNNLYYDLNKNRRGLGFDKPSGNKNGPTCECVSMESFGHTGFTGTMAWVDPKTETIFVFLSNRTYPDGNAANKLSKENIRSRIQEVIAKAIIE